jgi:YidC/Oxa1 family membrane protein insertase
MERNSTIGYILILGLFAGFWYFNKDNQQLLEETNADKTEVVDVAAKDKDKLSTAITSDEGFTGSVRDTSSIDLVSESITLLQNELISIDFTDRGGVPKKVILKNYQRYDSSALVLFEGNEMELGYTFPLASGVVINTRDKNFTAVTNNEDEVVYTLALGNGAYIKQTYTLAPNSYKVDYKVQFDGMPGILAPNNRFATLDWKTKLQGQEKTLKDEKAATTVYFKYTSDDDVDYLSETSDEDEETLTANVKWVSFKQKFFNQTLIHNTQFTEDGTQIEIKDPGEEGVYVKEAKAQFYIPLEQKSVLEDMDLYYGPNHYPTLKEQDIELQKIIPLGWGVFGWVNKLAIIPLFNWLSNFFSNYGLIILLLTLTIKMTLFPFMYKVYKSTAKMRMLKPELDEIKERTGDDAQKAQQEQMKLYKQAGVSPLGGCLPQLVQMPILFAMFRFFPASIELRQESLWWADDLSTYDSIYDLGFNIPFYGDHISLFTLMMTAVTILYTYMNSQNSGQMVGPMKTIMYVMPVMFLGFFNNYAAALSFYYFLSTCITVIQNFVIRKFVIDEDKLRMQIVESKKKKIKVKKKSGMQKKLEEMAKKRGIDPYNGKAKPKSTGDSKKRK